MFVYWDMNYHEQFIELRRQIDAKHGSLAAAMRAGGADPDSREMRNQRRNIEHKTKGTRPVRIWDVWALRWLLGRRKQG